MSRKSAVVAIGGNSLIKDKQHQTVRDQYIAAGETCWHVASMIKDGWDVAIGQARADEVLLGLHGNATRIPAVGFEGARLRNGAGERQCGHLAEGIDERGGRIGNGEHVAGFDALPSADGTAIKSQSFLENALLQLADGATEVLPGAKRVHKLQIEHPGSGLFGLLNNLFGCVHALFVLLECGQF